MRYLHTPFKHCWRFFTSIKLAIVLIAVIAAVSIVGTVIEPAHGRPEHNIGILSSLVGAWAAPYLYQALDAMGFMDNMYRSWWFITLLLLFALNLLICSLDRLPRVLKIIRTSPSPLPASRFATDPRKKELLLAGSPEQAVEQVAATMRRAGFFPTRTPGPEAGEYQLVAQRGGYSRLGSYLIHLSILIILAGALVGELFGFRAGVDIPEGSATDVVYTRYGEEIPLGFTVRCDNFQVSFYDQTDIPRAYESTLTVIEEGGAGTSRVIDVNTPLKHRGITFYQSSYGLVPNAIEHSVFIFRITPVDGQPVEKQFRFGDHFAIPGTDLVALIDDFSPALGMDRDGNLVTYAQQMNNPSVLLLFFTRDGEWYDSQWLMQRRPDSWRLRDGHTVEFVDLWGMQYTGLQVKKDPGIWIVYTGFMMLCIGLGVAFWVSHIRVWVRVQAAGSRRVKVTFCGTTNNNPPGLLRLLEKMAAVAKQPAAARP